MEWLDSPLWNFADTLLLNLLIASTLIWASVGSLTVVWFRSSAAIRHRLWGLSFFAVLVTPGMMGILPIPRWSPHERGIDLISVYPAKNTREGLGSENIQPESSFSHAVGTSNVNQVQSETVSHHGQMETPLNQSSGPISKFSSICSLEWRRIVVAIWLLGVAISSVCVAGALLWTFLWKRRMILFYEGREVDRTQILRQKLRIVHPIAVGTSIDLKIPIIVGYFHPTIGLPIGVGRWSESQLDVVLIHELIHAHRNDVLWKLLGRVCLVFVWFHPFAWLVYRRFNLECEHACDDAVLKSGSSAHEYAEHLVNLAADIHLREQRIPALAFAIARCGQLECRIRSILDTSIGREPVGHPQSVAFLTLTALGMLIITALTPELGNTPRSFADEISPTLGTSAVVDLQQVTTTESSEESATASIVPDSSKQAQSSEISDLLKLVGEAIDVTSRRHLQADAHSPWQIFHAIHAMGQNCTLKTNSGSINAIDWISLTEPTFDREPLLQMSSTGPRFHPYTRRYAFEGHPGQFLALLTSANLPSTHQFHVEGNKVTISDLINHLKSRANEKEEMTWLLWALQHYLELDATWENQFGDKWSIERLVARETTSPIVGAPNGGTNRLYVLSLVINKYRRLNGNLNGIWAVADQKIQRHVDMAHALQNSDGTFSAEWFRGSHQTSDVNQRLNTTGHTLEFLTVTLPEDRLEEPWIERAVSVLSRDLILHKSAKIDVAPLFHSLHALNLYRDRIRASSGN